MSTKPGAYLGGIRTVDDVRLRCYVDPETDCWHWRLHFARGRTQCVWLGADGQVRKGAAARAAWELAGRRLAPGWIVSRDRRVCESEDCCNPAHHRAGPRAKVIPALTEEQRLTHRIATTRASRQRASLSMDAARRIRQSGETLAAEAAKWGVSPSTVSQVRRGETWREVILGPA